MKDTKRKKKIDAVLDRMFKDLVSSLVRELPEYFIKVSQVKKSDVFVRKPRSKILGRKKEILFEIVENISKNITFNYARGCSDLKYAFFPYFKLVRSFGSYHFHFLVIRKEYPP